MTIFKGVTLFHHPGFTLGTSSSTKPASPTLHERRSLKPKRFDVTSDFDRGLSPAHGEPAQDIARIRESVWGPGSNFDVIINSFRP